jgi:hypothetical protein
VREALDQLIDSHHDNSTRLAVGGGSNGESDGQELGLRSISKGDVVSLLPPEHGKAADYPVLQSQPASSNIRLRPDQEREISVKSLPPNHWPALAQLHVEPDAGVTELTVMEERLPDHVKLTMLFTQPEDFDTDQYPIRAKILVTARFNGVKEPRQLTLNVMVQPDTNRVPPEPVLLDDPTKLKVRSREPVKITASEFDSHVQLRWNGKDDIVSGPNAKWRFSASLIDGDQTQPAFNFSEPSLGRFSLLISPQNDWITGQKLTFQVTVAGPIGKILTTTFVGEVVGPHEAVPESASPRLMESQFMAGASRRPPYTEVYLSRQI